MDVSIDAVSGHHKGLFPRKLSNDADCHFTSGGAGRSCRGDSLRGESIWQRDFRYYTMGTWAMSSATIAAVFAILVMLYYVVKETKDPLDGLTITPVEMEVPTFGHLFKRFAFEGGTICLLSSILVLSNW